jgi:hypothetical protein
MTLSERYDQLRELQGWLAPTLLPRLLRSPDRFREVYDAGYVIYRPVLDDIAEGLASGRLHDAEGAAAIRMVASKASDSSASHVREVIGHQ